jgi:hypothetical protein
VKTEDLISLLARDATPVRRGLLQMRLVGFALMGAFIALFILIPWLGLRPDLSEAVSGMNFWMKAIYTFGLGAAGFALTERLARPGARGGIGWLLAAVSAGLIAAFAINQLMATPPEQMREVLMGSTWDTCPLNILALSLPGQAMLLWSMRKTAPTRPMLAGAAAGLLAGGLAATLGVILSALTGAIVGSRALRW